MHIKDLCRTAHQDSARNGWYSDGDRNLGEMICLMHSELSEAMEALRKPNEDGSLKESTKIPGFSELVEELADCMIRIADFAEYQSLPLEDAISAKMAMNRTRGFKHGGKSF